MTLRLIILFLVITSNLSHILSQQLQLIAPVKHAEKIHTIQTRNVDDILLTASEDQTIKLWRQNDGSLLKTINISGMRLVQPLGENNFLLLKNKNSPQLQVVDFQSDQNHLLSPLCGNKFINFLRKKKLKLRVASSTLHDSQDVLAYFKNKSYLEICNIVGGELHRNVIRLPRTDCPTSDYQIEFTDDDITIISQNCSARYSTSIKNPQKWIHNTTRLTSPTTLPEDDYLSNEIRNWLSIQATTNNETIGPASAHSSVEFSKKALAYIESLHSLKDTISGISENPTLKWSMKKTNLCMLWPTLAIWLSNDTNNSIAFTRAIFPTSQSFTSCAFSSDGSQLAIGYSDGTIAFLEKDTPPQNDNFFGCSLNSFSAANTGQDQAIIYNDSKLQIRHWDERTMPSQAEDSVIYAQFAPRKNLLYVAKSDGEFYFQDIDSTQKLRPNADYQTTRDVQGNPTPLLDALFGEEMETDVSNIAFSHDGNFFCLKDKHLPVVHLGSFDESQVLIERIWLTDTLLSEFYNFMGIGDFVDVAFTRDNRLLLLHSEGISFIDTDHFKNIKSLPAGRKELRQIEKNELKNIIATDDDRIAVEGSKKILVFSLANGKLLDSWKKRDSEITGFFFSNSGGIITSDIDRFIEHRKDRKYLWRLDTMDWTL